MIFSTPCSRTKILKLLTLNIPIQNGKCYKASTQEISGLNGKSFSQILPNTTPYKPPGQDHGIHLSYNSTYTLLSTHALKLKIMPPAHSHLFCGWVPSFRLSRARQPLNHQSSASSQEPAHLRTSPIHGVGSWVGAMWPYFLPFLTRPGIKRSGPSQSDHSWESENKIQRQLVSIRNQLD